ncbi:MAG: GNAT family N-acetyltransferase, partial [Clostridiales bacterium]|nr:GNAT family N-acetyltransferase [Clostridiales bacterium]
IGTKAVNYAFDKARSLGKAEMIVWVFTDNANSVKFYESCGFVKDGKVKPYDCGRIIQCIRMRRAL